MLCRYKSWKNKLHIFWSTWGESIYYGSTKTTSEEEVDPRGFRHIPNHQQLQNIDEEMDHEINEAMCCGTNKLSQRSPPLAREARWITDRSRRSTSKHTQRSPDLRRRMVQNIWSSTCWRSCHRAIASRVYPGRSTKRHLQSGETIEPEQRAIASHGNRLQYPTVDGRPMRRIKKIPRGSTNTKSPMSLVGPSPVGR